MAWAAVAGAAISVVGGAMGASKGRKAQRQQDARRLEGGRGNMDAQYEYSRQQQGLANQYQSYSQRPGMMSNGYGTSTIDPSTGQTSFQLNERYQGLRDQALRGADQAYAQAGTFDPKMHAQERYNSAQGLLAAGDAQDQSSLMQDLYSKGGFGLTTNQTAAGGAGSVGVNPYLNTFMNARNQRNATMSYGSLREGEQYLDGLIGRGRGLLGDGRGIDQLGVGSMNSAMDYRNQFNRDYKDMLGMRGAANQSQLQGTRDYYSAWGGIDAGAGANNQAQMINGATGAIGGMFSNGSMNGLFSGGGQVGQGGMTQAPIYSGGTMTSAPIYG